MSRRKSHNYDKPRTVTDSLGKLPPQVLDLEEAVLGAVILEKNAILSVADVLKPNHFYDDRHKEIYAAIIDLFKATDPVDMRTVVNQLRKNGKIELVGGPHYIAELTSKVNSAANIDSHCRIIIEMAIKRALILLAGSIQQDAYDDTQDVFKLLDRITLDLENVSDGSITNQAEKHVKELAIKSIENLQQRQQGVTTGVLSRFKALDDITHGFQNTDLIILGARPGQGKSALTGCICYNIAKGGDPVGMFSLEMPGIQVVDRTAIGLSEIDPDKIKSGNINPLEMTRWVHFNGQISNLSWYIDDTAGLGIIELRARARRMKVKYGIKLLVVDYIQLINGRIHDDLNRDQEISIITRTLKQIAKELEIPVIAISSLNRSVETRGGDKRPNLSDLRDSGSIESDADVVMFLYRPEYYKITVDEDGLPTHGKAEVIFAKHRNGSLGTAILKFIGKFTKFVDWTDEYSSYSGTAGTITRNYKDPTESSRDNPYGAGARLHEDDSSTPF